MVDRSEDIPSSNWQEKYLKALDIQEASERHVALLRRVLVRVSLSADGQDESLDQALDHLRRRLRSGDLDIEELKRLFDELDGAVAGFNQRRQNSSKKIAESLAATVNPLKRYTLSRPLKKEISLYLGQVLKGSESVYLYPALLQQLVSIQHQALKELHQPEPGFWQKLLRRNKKGTNPLIGVSADNMTRMLEKGYEPPMELGVETRHHDFGIKKAALLGSPDSSDFTDKISQILGDILSKVEVPEPVSGDADLIRQRIAQGLNQDDLIVTIEHVRDLVIKAYLAANQAFATYLHNINQELVDIHEVLGGAARSEVKRREDSLSLQHTMMQEVAKLQTDVAGATELKQLKERVNSQLGNIRQTLSNLQQAEQQEFAGHLRALAEKIKTMEDDAERNRTTMEKHRFKALHDPLTELPNREAYNERVNAEWLRWQRYGHPLIMAVCDLDHFKKINDTFGHQAGDRVLKVISRSIAKRLREVDFFGRYGGEEFIVIMPETEIEKALAVMEKICSAIAKTEFNYQDELLTVTLSIGIAQFTPGDTVDSVFARADAALYSAKAAGRNRCEIAE